MKILVVEDEPLLAMLLEESVTELGHEVAGAAATVDQALAMLDEITVELALLDFTLGQQTTSVPIAVRLRESGIPFLYLSGHRTLGEDGDIPPAPLLTKPFSLDQLDAAIRGLPIAA
ncbi:MAG: response regulator [Novosphingobium sp.]